ncbi:MAG: hypothetical protein HN921_08925 [Bacteroidetes bacterium]|nr:hypothetical protein [Bacteroidota bacterium]
MKYIPSSKGIIHRDKFHLMNTEICNFNNSESIKLIPEDFTFNNNYETDELLKLFNKIQTILSIISLYDITSLNKSKFSATLSGQKKLKTEIDFDDLLCNQDFFKIYNWVYRSGDIEEKIGLARNIISIHYIDNIFKIADNTFVSLKSNYKLYLKSNTKNYLEMKSQIEDHLWNTNRQMDSIKKEFSKNLFASLIGVLTFFITVILTGALTANKPVVFTEQVLLLSWIFVSIFFLILVFKSIEEFFSIKKLKAEYENMISRYKNLIDNQEFKTYEKTKNNFEFNLFSVNRILGFLLTVAIIICLLFSNNFSIEKNNQNKRKKTCKIILQVFEYRM